MQKRKLNMAEVKAALSEKMAEHQEAEVLKIRSKWMDRWAEISGCPKLENGQWDYSKIDYENEFVKLEWYLCDPNILFKVTDDKYRAAGIMMLPEDVRETYFKIGPNNSKPYSEIYMGMSAIKHGLHIAKKEGKNR